MTKQAMKIDKSPASSGWRTGHLAIDLAILSLFFAVIFGPYLFTSRAFAAKPFFSDMLSLTLPTVAFTGQGLASGAMPLWDPYTFCGYPLLAMGCPGTLYPTTILHGWLPFWLSFKVDVLLHLYLMGVGAYLAGRLLFRHRATAVALAAMMLSSRMLMLPVWLGHLWCIRTLAWAPWAFLCLWLVLARGRAVWALGFALCCGLQMLAGDPQVFVYQMVWLGLLTAAMLLYRILFEGLPRPVAIRRGLLCLGAVVLAVGLAAPQLLPAQELMRHSIRKHGVTLEYASVYSATLGFYEAELFSPEGRQVLLAGPLLLGLLVSGLLFGQDRRRFIFALMVLFAFFFALWPTSPLGPLILRIPLIGQSRAPVRMWFFGAFAAYILAGYGADRLLKPGDQGKPGRAGLLTAAGIAILLALPALAFTMHPVRFPLMLACALAGCGALAAGAWPGRSRIAAASLLGVYLLAECAAFAMTREPSLVLPTTARYSQAQDFEVPEDFLAFSRARTDRDRIAIFSPQPILRSAGTLTGDRMLGGCHALHLEIFGRWRDALTPIDYIQGEGGRHGGIAGPGMDWVDEPSVRALDMMNIRYLITTAPSLAVPETDATGAGRRYRKSTVGALTVYENRLAVPAAYSVHAVQAVASNDEAISAIQAPEFDYRTSAVVTDPSGAPAIDPAAGEDDIAITTYGPRAVEIAADMRSAGLVVLTDVFYPGWRAFVDGQPAGVLPANGLFRGVVVPAGQHAVRFEYAPLSFTVGCAASVVALVILLGAGVCLMVQSRRRHGAAG